MADVEERDPRAEPAWRSSVHGAADTRGGGRGARPRSRDHAPRDDLELTVRTYRTALRLLLHDTFEPLSRIRALLGLLREDPSQVEDVDGFLDRILDDLDGVGELLSAVEELERLTDRAARTRRSETDLRAFTHEILRGLDHTTHDVRLEIERSAPPIDRFLVGRALANLIGNALTHTPIGTTVWIRARTGAEHVTFVVEDDGPGIPEDLHGRIFEPFERGISPDSTPGIGLGLALVRGIAEMLGGSVTVEEAATGGASFCMALPLPPDS